MDTINQPLVVLILGLPSAGKTTLAKKLSRELNLPLVIKDDLKVILLDTYGWKDRETSMQAGGASYKLMDYFIEGQIKHGNSLIVESTFDPKYDDARFQSWQEKYGVRYVQVYCYADADTIRQRFKERAGSDNRHVSYTEDEAGLQNLEKYIRQGFSPLNIDSKIIKVDTTDFSKVDEAGIIEQVKVLG
jgi:predicted kinase